MLLCIVDHGLVSTGKPWWKHGTWIQTTCSRIPGRAYGCPSFHTFFFLAASDESSQEKGPAIFLYNCVRCLINWFEASASTTICVVSKTKWLVYMHQTKRDMPSNWFYLTNRTCMISMHVKVIGADITAAEMNRLVCGNIHVGSGNKWSSPYWILDLFQLINRLIPVRKTNKAHDFRQLVADYTCFLSFGCLPF